ncbi:phage tail terminator family protein [Lachnoclostridium phytofermentans]|uniref:phage tail terminator family protein n=1 Tax=Lachnoclostridium phytofermentans TaxID=66219 RepID=UPI000497AD29|nr:hypothetical protein [Lachnoclostridium phytofermentans]
MVKQVEILRSINRILADSFPNYTVHINTCPEKFTRPAFLLELVRSSQTDANRTTVDKTVYYTITCFTTVDNRYKSDAEELIDLQEKVLQLFTTQGYVTVGDRAIKVSGSTGGLDIDRAYIDLQFEYFDNRTDEEDSTPLITSVYTKIRRNNNEAT